jgi:hypothetical protein
MVMGIVMGVVKAVGWIRISSGGVDSSIRHTIAKSAFASM